VARTDKWPWRRSRIFVRWDFASIEARNHNVRTRATGLERETASLGELMFKLHFSGLHNVN
jgi:hypothetical protein